MDVLGLVEVLLDAQHFCPAAQAAESGLCGFFHHVAQVAGQLQLAGALHDVDLHFQDLAACLCPRKAVDHADLLPLRMERRGERLAIEQLGKLFFCNGNTLYSSCQQAHIRLSAHRSQAALQLTDAGLSGIVPNDGAQHLIPHPEGSFLQAVLRHLFGQQVALCDLHLFLVRIAAQLDYFHPIQQRPGDGVRGIGSGDEHDL